MKIKEITFQLRNDFEAIMVCEGCGASQELTGGYNDTYYHNNVIPTMKCGNCRKSRNDLIAAGEGLE